MNSYSAQMYKYSLFFYNTIQIGEQFRGRLKPDFHSATKWGSTQHVAMREGFLIHHSSGRYISKLLWWDHLPSLSSMAMVMQQAAKVT